MDTQATKQITPEQFALLGITDIAYVKPVTGEAGETLFGIYAADGRQVGVMADRDVAFAAVRQNELEPVSVH